MLLYQPTNGYCYNSDTYCLFNFITIAMQKYKNIHGGLLDIGSGSGILGLLLSKEYPKLQLDASEIQEDFIFLSNKNANINKIKLNMNAGNFINFVFDRTYDIIVSNPPFYPSSVVKSTNENIKIARYNDSLPLENFISKVSFLLKPNGKFFFCYDVKLLNDIILLLKKYSLNTQEIQFLHPKINKDASLVMIYARKNSKSLMSIRHPFVMFKDNEFTKEMQDVYDKCNTHSIKVEL
jgi:tRNA1Val (adenine37-N6)-methyltransferase